ncbi:RNA polymerase sigma factor [Planctomicrobium sp. SH664]|uniref:RNA polymerase sigma factor n=1 Tax=Planctomicrobium sp. SH664 TaxID=3448125 RepID=UPI003F5C91A1
MPFVETDRRILARCLQREPGAWEEFVDRFIGVFVHVIRHTAYVRSVELSADDIEDLCSEIYVTLLKNDFSVLRHFKGHSSLATYLAVVARRIVVKSIVQRRKSEAMGHIIAHHSNLHVNGVEGGGHADAEQVRALLNQLSPSEAAIVRLFYLEGKSYHEISTQLRIPENSIGPTLHRARERMRDVKVPNAG